MADGFTLRACAEAVAHAMRSHGRIRLRQHGAITLTRTGVLLLNATQSDGAPMRSINEWFDSYGSDHQNPTNVVITLVDTPLHRRKLNSPATFWQQYKLLISVEVKPSSLAKPLANAALATVRNVRRQPTIVAQES